MKDSNAILIVDDNEFNRDLLRRRLSKFGYTIVVAENGEQALYYISENPKHFDLVLLDIMMPGINGFEVLVSIRKEYSAIALPVIMITAKAQNEDIVQAFELGVNDYITKPVNFTVALARISTQLSYKRAGDALITNDSRFEWALKGAKDGLWDWDFSSGTIYFSSRFEEVLGYPEKGLGSEPKYWLSRLHPNDQVLFEQALKTEKERFEAKVRVLNKEGLLQWMHYQGLVLRGDNGQVLRIAGSQTDMTDALFYDSLTGLPNRVYFEDQLNQALKKNEYQDPHSLLVIRLAIDAYQDLHHHYGYEHCDQLIMQLVDRLKKFFNTCSLVSKEAIQLAYFYQGEFGILLVNIEDKSVFNVFLDKLRTALQAPYQLLKKEVFVTCSLGIACIDSEKKGYQPLIQNANIALSKAQANGRNSLAWFQPLMQENLEKKVQCENHVHHTVHNDDFEVYYQPIVELQSNKTVGVEALLRCKVIAKKIMTPSEFIHMSQKMGLQVDIDKRIFQQVCDQMKKWSRFFTAPNSFFFSINLSNKHFSDADMVPFIRETLEKCQLSPSKLTLEITENELIEKLQIVSDNIDQLTALGIQLACDDFGTGFSSLSYLHCLPINTIKIDQSFVKKLSSDKQTNSIVKAICHLAKNLDKKLIAEGIETQEQLAILKDLDCQYGQGYLFSKPVSAEVMEKRFFEDRVLMGG